MDSPLARASPLVAESRSRRRDLVVAVALVVLGLGGLGRFVDHQRSHHGDEGYVDYVAWRIAEGDVPFRDLELFGHLPGLFVAHSWIWRLVDDPVAATRWVWAALFAINAALVYRLGVVAGTRAGGLVAALALLLVPGPWDRAPIATLGLLLLFALLGVCRHSGPVPRGWMRLGLVLAAAVWLRADAAFVAVALAIALLVVETTGHGREWHRAAGRLAAGFALGLAPLAAILASDGVLDDAVRQIIGFLGLAVERTGAARMPWPPLPWPPLPTSASVFAVFFHLSLLVPAGLVAVVLAARRISPDRAPLVLALAWLAGNLPQYLLERPDLPHLAARVFALLVAGLFALGRLEGAPRRLVATAATAVVVAYVAAFAGLWQTGLPWFQTRPPTVRTLANGLRHVSLSAGRADLLEIVLARSAADAPVATLPYAPGLNVALRRRMPGRQVYLAPHSLRRPGAEAESIAALEQTRTPFVLVLRRFRTDANTDPVEAARGRARDPRLESFAPAVWRHIEERYVAVAESDGLTLYARRD